MLYRIIQFLGRQGLLIMSGAINPAEIAQEMADAVKPLGDSDTADLLYSLIEGVVDTGKDYGYLVYDFLDTDSKNQKDNDKYRLVKLVKDGIDSNKILQAFDIIFSDYYQKLTVKQQQLLLRRKSANIAGGAWINNALFSSTTTSLISVFWKRFIIGLGMTTTYTVGGKMSRAVYSSRQLMMDNPTLYWKLRTEGDLDLIYFLIEKQVEPFVRASQIQHINPMLFNEINDSFLSMEIE